MLLAPMATRIATDMELDFASFMMKNSALLSGTYGTAVTTWSDIARGSAVMESSGVPKDSTWCAAVNPYTQAVLADTQRSLGAGGSAGSEVVSALKNATLSENFAGMTVLSASTLASYTSATTGDLVGAFSAAPTPTYVGAKDTMTQTWALDGFGSFAGSIPAGAVLQVTGRNRLNLSTRQPIVDDTGANVLFTATVTEASANFSSGAGTVTVTGPGIFEAAGQYNTVDAALADNDVVTILGADTTLYQPNLMWHKQAFSIGSVPLKKLYATDTIATTEDGLQIRITKYSDGTANTQKVRFDLRPAYGVMNPFFSGQLFG